PALTPEQRQARADSIAEVRSETVKQLMTTISGKENQPASQVFKNIQIMKNIPAAEFLTAMDQGIGRGTGHGCTDCHVPNDWASDSVARKKTARTMMGIVSDINTSLLPRMGPGRGGQPRAISCITCHRGGQAGRNVTIP
ncbi:MAG TPA: photosynthetic reaction center cytochrome c subunit family protein, partial [Gemmatimonadaceae bacterium]|nr:photosynthetic reaction center cytochrome c subunit family protein [Gemmatimonadaceae bacterium]